MTHVTDPDVLHMLKQHPHAVVVHADADALMVHPYLSAAFDGVGMVDGTLPADVRAHIIAALRNGDTPAPPKRYYITLWTTSCSPLWSRRAAADPLTHRQQPELLLH